MNKILIGVVVVVLIIGGLYYFSQKNYQPAQNQPITQQTTIQGNAVTIQNFSFNPSALIVKVGTKVTWTNQDSTVHKIKSDTFNSPDMNQGDTFNYTFTTIGSFDYSCSIHPSMTGKIIVE